MGHRTNVFKNGLEIEEHKSRYYNRTWESYTFQSCMFGAISEIEYKEKMRFVDNYKYENNIDRFKKGQKDEILAMFEETEIAKELNELRKVVENRDFD